EVEVARLVRLPQQGRDIVEVVGLDLAEGGPACVGVLADHDQPPFEQLQVRLLPQVSRVDHVAPPTSPARRLLHARSGLRWGDAERVSVERDPTAALATLTRGARPLK